MLCFICNKNPATIHIQEIVDGVKKTIHICQTCAAEKGLNISVSEGINFTEFLQKISFDNDKPFHIDEDKIRTTDILICPKCRWDSEKMRKTGRLGCPECYHSFKDKLVQSLAAMHRGIIHCGKIPSSAAGGRNVFMANILKLQRMLEKHIKNEEYEEAAKIRDKLKYLK